MTRISPERRLVHYPQDNSYNVLYMGAGSLDASKEYNALRRQNGPPAARGYLVGLDTKTRYYFSEDYNVTLVDHRNGTSLDAYPSGTVVNRPVTLGRPYEFAPSDTGRIRTTKEAIGAVALVGDERWGHSLSAPTDMVVIEAAADKPNPILAMDPRFEQAHNLFADQGLRPAR